MSMDGSHTQNTQNGSNVHFEAVPSRAELSAYIADHVDEAIAKGWVKPYYQPVVRTLTGKLCGSEALARWEDPVFGLLTPDKFVPVLEDARLINKVDSCIVREVCRQIRESADEGVPVVPISFNLSRLDFDLCDIFGIIEDATREYEVPRRLLNIEITESTFATDPSFMVKIIEKFHSVGYQVWMDDFGSGYSSLNALKDFEFDEMKIDMEFLSRFGEKSKTILASVVDMAKKLGIQTQAEGVETEEQRVYMRRIGCEKMQGYLFGKPMPYNAEKLRELAEAIGVETSAERMYLREIGGVNTLSLSERDFTAGNDTHDYVTSMPLAIIEYANDSFKVLDSNRVFREGLANVGVSSMEVAEQLINDQTRMLARQARRLIHTIPTEQFVRIDYTAGETPCVMRAKYITTQDDRVAVLVTIDDTIEQGERKRFDRMNDALEVLYSIYEHVDIIHLDDEFLEPVFGNAGYTAQYDAPTFNSTTEHFARTEVYPSDRKRYMEFMEHSTMIQRIRESGENYLVGFFRTRGKGADYTWKLFALIHLADKPGNQVMLCIRSTHWANDGLFQAAFDRESKDIESPSDIENPDLRLTAGSLWRALAHDDDMALFWKDRDRKFVGANQAFLDYYGFESASEILGKTDEDMGWHIDPVPFKKDELRVLNEGAHLRDVVGQCIVRGEVRDIVATKRPVYRNGRIVGLVGYFVDLNDKMEVEGDFGRLPLVDSATGVFNYTGLESATWKFVDSYKRLGMDFAMISVNIESFQQINDDLGYDFGDKVLKRVAEELRDVAGQTCVIGHVYSSRFVVLSQNVDEAELQALCDEIERRLVSIAEVDGTPCTIFALAGYALYSKHEDIEAMKRYNRERRIERRDAWADQGLNEADIITSSIL